jgi:hypothetical protein
MRIDHTHLYIYIYIYIERERERERERESTEVGSGVVERQSEVIGDVIERERMVGRSRVCIWVHFLTIDDN